MIVVILAVVVEQGTFKYRKTAPSSVHLRSFKASEPCAKKNIHSLPPVLQVIFIIENLLLLLHYFWTSIYVLESKVFKPILSPVHGRGFHHLRQGNVYLLLEMQITTVKVKYFDHFRF